MKVAFLGLGVMGGPMAGHLAKAGHDVVVWNRSTAKSADWEKHHEGVVANSIEAAVKDCDVVCACVGNDNDAREVGFAAVAAMSSGSLYIDHTTTSATCATDIAAKATARGVGFVDAPVSGGEAGAVNGQLAIMCGGSDADMDHAKPIMDAYAKRIVHIGPVGQGQLCKSSNQIAIAGVLQGLSEAMHFAKQANLDIDLVLEAISGGSAQSWQMENRGKTMCEDKFDFGFAVEWMHKDLKIALAEAEKKGATLPVTAMINQYYAQVMKKGGARWDTSSLIKLLEE